MKKINKALLIINYKKNIPSGFLTSLASVFHSCKTELFVYPEAVEYLITKASDLNYRVAENIQEIDMAIVLGGDGSILNAAMGLCSYDIPILGINFGTLGYMAELEAADVSMVKEVLCGNYVVENRMMISPCIVHADGSKTVLPPALNDVVISNGPIARILNFKVSCNDVLIKKCRADGMVIATPTGSTAYSMSAGGPILAPSLNALCLTPICPHSFSNRPIILQGGSIVKLYDIEVRENSVYVTVDGRMAKEMGKGDSLVITRAEAETKLIRLKNNSFLSVLSSKLQDV